ncbi:MAG: xanthine dehydrogenase family protein [Clostridia bacterium]|nr:xanthine dehydrogenase family protein [Clostridia bacterium]
MLHAAFVRSPHPHARIRGIDVRAALDLPGVVAVLTAADLRAICKPMRPPALEGMKPPTYEPLAGDKVRFVGDPVALVVAEDRYVAEDGRDRVVVDYEPLPAVANMEQALDPARPPLFEEMGDNVLYHRSFSYGDPDGAFAQADRVVRETFRQHRYANVPMETRGGIAAYDPASGELTYYAATQAHHALRYHIANLIGQPMESMRVVTHDVGGAFGQKWTVYREDVALCAASRLLGRPVKWIEDRVENLTAAGQAREETLEVEAAVKNDGTLLALRVRMTMDQGAYPLVALPSPLFTNIVRVMLPSAYRIHHYAFDATILCTNKAPYIAYRGPWEVETWVRERLLDIIARELGLDPVDIRRKNLYTREELPTRMVTGPTLDRITARETLERAVELAGYEAFRQEQRRARAEGRYLGLGVATFIEAAPGPPDYRPAIGFGKVVERAEVRLEPNGHLTVYTGQAPHGQGHETTLAQVAAQEMGVPFEHVRVVWGDTRMTPFNLSGTGGSRAATFANGAVLHATRKLKEKVAAVAAHLLEAHPDDLEFVDASVRVKGAPGSALPLAQVAARAYTGMAGLLAAGIDPNLHAGYDFDGGEGGWTQGTHVCAVEVDLETGQVKILRYLAVDDCGTVINPNIVEGQIRGGVAQGIGGVLYEHAAYDEDGQFLAGTLMDYLVPTAMEIPPIEVDHGVQTPPVSPVNFRGVGEGGAIVAPAALTNAIEDALAPLGVRITEQYLPPSRILELAGVIEAPA